MSAKRDAAKFQRQMTVKNLPTIAGASDMLQAINMHLFYTLLKDRDVASNKDLYTAIALSLRDQMASKWIRTRRHYKETNAKHVYYLSMEFYLGRFLKNAICNLGLDEVVDETLENLGIDKTHIFPCEPDAGLGNGGLGRLAACFLDSMATLQIPCYGYGLVYEYGIFKQLITPDGDQLEEADDWLRSAYVWQVPREHDAVDIPMYGECVDGVWKNAQYVRALPYDVPIPGYKNNVIGTLRLWKAKATRELSFEMFNTGDYVRAMEAKNDGENITRVLYPDDSTYMGKELRLKQEYLLVAASIRDILKRHLRIQAHHAEKTDELQATTGGSFNKFFTLRGGSVDRRHVGLVKDLLKNFQEKNAIQMNDTHPSLAVPELMRILLDDCDLTWPEAADAARASFFYTNHTILPEALERWPLEMLKRLLPRHLEIIYQMNALFLADVRVHFNFTDDARISEMSLIEEGETRKVRMANLAIVGSSHVNGVAAIHSQLIRETLFKNFVDYYGSKGDLNHFLNVTNGVTPRRWIVECNPELTELIKSTIGDHWISDLPLLGQLEAKLNDTQFLAKLKAVKREKKLQFAAFLAARHGLTLDPDWLLSVQVKRIHEYKRQLMNLVHIVMLFDRLRQGEQLSPRAFVIGGKAAPSYSKAKCIIKLANKIAKVIDADPVVKKSLKLIFMPNYDVSTAEIAIPAADISEQISLAGMEASGTGNMKFMMNGAVTVGTMDGANVEIHEAVGDDAIFTFGMTVPEVPIARSTYHEDRAQIVANDQSLSRALNMIRGGFFFPERPDYFASLVDDLTGHDQYMVLKDIGDYARAEAQAAACYYKDAEQREWYQMALRNIAQSGRFSSDESIKNYASNIWRVPFSREPLPN